MAASDTQQHQPPPRGPRGCLTAAELHERIEEEINRAARHAGALGCLLVDIEDLAAIERDHGAALAEQALAYVGLALRREFRCFDRVGRPSESEFAVVLPGADAPRGEIVARRTLTRLHAIKLEADAARRSLRVAVGIAAWREGMSAEQLIAHARTAARREPANGSFAGASPPPRPSASDAVPDFRDPR
jgi:diguanylate cyclase (GGDEF)-like protein